MSQQEQDTISTMQQMMAQMKAQNEQMTAMQAELAELKSRSNLQSNLPQQLPTLSNNFPSEVTKPSLTTNNRRKMLKAGVLLAGLAVTSLAATTSAPAIQAQTQPGDSHDPGTPLPDPTFTKTNEKGSPTRSTTGGNVLIGTSNAPTNASDGPTRLFDPSSTDLSPVLFKVDNFTTNLLTPPSNTRFGIIGTVSGADTQTYQRVGVYGATDTGQNTGYGVYGVGTTGVYGSGTTGIWGNTSVANGNAVYAYASSADGWGIEAFSVSSYGGVFDGGRSNIRLTASGITPLARTDSHSGGEVIVDSTGNAWICVYGGTPGTWRQLAGVDTAGSLHLLTTPYRVVNTREGTSLNSSTGDLSPFSSVSNVGSVTKNFNATGGSSGVPSTAVAVIGHLHVHPAYDNLRITPGFGYLTVWKQGTAYPTATATEGIATVYFIRGAVATTQFTVALSSSGQFSVASDTATDLIVDITGYYL